MYATPSPVPQQERLFPCPDGRPSRPYRVPVYRVTLVRECRLPHAQPQLGRSRDAAILSNAAALLCCHNHPSGAPQPSQEDRALTKRLVDAGQLLGITVLDHIILVRRESTK